MAGRPHGHDLLLGCIARHLIELNFTSASDR
jgi:hypothetical protein